MTNVLKELRRHYFKMPNEIALNPNITPAAFRLFAFIAVFDECRPSLKYIESKTGLSKPTLIKATNELVRLKLIRVVPGGKNKPNVYIINRYDRKKFKL